MSQQQQQEAFELALEQQRQRQQQQQEARERLIKAIPHIVLAMSAAKVQGIEGSVVQLATIVKHPDGSGRVTSTFEGEEFLVDVAKVLGFDSLIELIAR